MELLNKRFFGFLVLFFLCIFSYNFIEAADSEKEENMGVIVIAHGAPGIWNDKVLKLVERAVVYQAIYSYW